MTVVLSLRHTQAACLYAVEESPNIGNADLAALMGLAYSNCASTMRRLERYGFVESQLMSRKQYHGKPKTGFTKVYRLADAGRYMVAILRQLPNGRNGHE